MFRPADWTCGRRSHISQACFVVHHIIRVIVISITSLRLPSSVYLRMIRMCQSRCAPYDLELQLELIPEHRPGSSSCCCCCISASSLRFHPPFPNIQVFGALSFRRRGAGAPRSCCGVAAAHLLPAQACLGLGAVGTAPRLLSGIGTFGAWDTASRGGRVGAAETVSRIALARSALESCMFLRCSSLGRLPVIDAGGVHASQRSIMTEWQSQEAKAEHLDRKAPAWGRRWEIVCGQRYLVLVISHTGHRDCIQDEPRRSRDKSVR